MKRILKLVLALLVLINLASSPALAGGGADAVSFVKKLGDTALMSLTKKDLSRNERESRVRKILNENFDVNTIGKFALGTNWRTATKAQQDEYLKLFEEMIVQTYTTRFEDYAGQKLSVGKSVTSGKDILVSSQVLQQDGPPINLEWRIRNKEGGFKVIDVVVENISMSVTQRSDFASVIQKNGGDINGLLTSLREKNKAVASGKKG